MLDRHDRQDRSSSIQNLDQHLKKIALKLRYALLVVLAGKCRCTAGTQA